MTSTTPSTRTGHPLRIPAIAVGVAFALVAVAFALDAGSSGARDAALIVGSIALYVLLPLTLVWLAVAAARNRRRR